MRERQGLKRVSSLAAAGKAAVRRGMGKASEGALLRWVFRSMRSTALRMDRSPIAAPLGVIWCPTAAQPEARRKTPAWAGGEAQCKDAAEGQRQRCGRRRGVDGGAPGHGCMHGRLGEGRHRRAQLGMRTKVAPTVCKYAAPRVP